MRKIVGDELWDWTAPVYEDIVTGTNVMWRYEPGYPARVALPVGV